MPRAIQVRNCAFCNRTLFRVRAIVRHSGIADACASSSARYGPCAATTRAAEKRTLRSEEHTSELQSLMRISYAVFCLKKKTIKEHIPTVKPNNPTESLSALSIKQ